jgi:hypothetical protein
MKKNFISSACDILKLVVWVLQLAYWIIKVVGAAANYEMKQYGGQLR